MNICGVPNNNSFIHHYAFSITQKPCSTYKNPQRMFFFYIVSSYKGPVAYWMNRDQRVDDNWALLKA